MSKKLFRKELASFKPYIPGKPIEDVKREFGLERIEKLASNENPLGPSPKALEAITNELQLINIYPDPAATALREELAKAYNVRPGNIVIGNGGEQILQVIGQTFINPGDEAIMAETTFDLYDSSVTLMGGIPVKVPLKNYKHDLVEFANRINERTKLIYICSPNNPTGNIAAKEEIQYMVERTPDDVVIVLDEAYYDYAKVNPDYPESVDILRKRPNTIILRTFSKVAGIAAVRIGFIITSEEIAQTFAMVRGTFSVNRLAQAAALGALRDREHIDRTVKLNYESLKMMEDYFDKKGLEYIKSNANFVFVNINKDSRIVFQKLMEKGIVIRPGFNWKWDTWIRVSTGTLEQTRLFIEKLDELL